MSELPTLIEVMAHVSELERAPTKEAANLARSLIAIKVARLTGDDVQAAFNVLRPAPEKAMTMSRMGGGAVRLVTAPMRDASQDQVVRELVSKLELVPVRREQDDVEPDDVPWVVTP